MMQAVMWGLLGVMVGLAALVGRSRAHPVRPATRAETYGHLTVALPAGWVVDKSSLPSRTSQFPAQVLTAQEPRGGPTGSRVLTVTQEAPTEPTTAEEYLAAKADVKLKSLSTAVVGGRRWLWVKSDPDEESGRRPAFAIYGCTVTRTGEVVTVQLEGPGDVGPEDEALFWHVADRIQFHDGQP